MGLLSIYHSIISLLLCALQNRGICVTEIIVDAKLMIKLKATIFSSKFYGSPWHELKVAPNKVDPISRKEKRLLPYGKHECDKHVVKMNEPQLTVNNWSVHKPGTRPKTLLNLFHKDRKNLQDE